MNQNVCKTVQKFVIFYIQQMFNPFLANVPFLYPLKTQENQKFSCVFRGYKMGILARNGLHKIDVDILCDRQKF